MRKGLVIADDLSGAAEIAGIAHRFGLSARIFRDGESPDLKDRLTVIETDSRSLQAKSVQQHLRRILADIPFGAVDFIYKKTDSALRGPIAAEIATLLELCGKSNAVLVPNNPSRGRAIAGGVYRINGVLLHETPFAQDPGWPATSSVATEILGAPRDPRIVIGESENIADVRRLAGECARDTLPAGGADFFEAMLRQCGLIEKPSPGPAAFDSPALFVCGTTAPSGRELAERANRIGVDVCAIPDGVFRGTGKRDVAVKTWCTGVSDAIHRCGASIATIGGDVDRSPFAAKHLHESLADLVANVLASHSLSALFIDGGATASAVCRKMNWRVFDVLREISAGIVTLQVAGHDRPLVTIKPGSYCWPDEVLEHRFGRS